ncbi:hypothetical protein [Pollutibacter soli]|uniref:hypothetical protein n=1 Tax=Pollutibacter soli TaxID=3034157 RepID=UPI003013697A
MRKIMLSCIILTAVAACKNSSTEIKAREDSIATKAVETTPAAPAIDYAYKPTLAADWTAGKPEYAAIVLNLYKALERNAPEDSVLTFFADSVTSVSYDDKTFKGTGKDFITRAKNFRNQYKKLSEEFISFVPLYSPSKDMHVVSIWVEERGVRNNGKADSTVYQENWRFDNAGKIDYRSVFARYSF